MALDETLKTIILMYVWHSEYRNNLWSGLPKKMGKIVSFFHVSVYALSFLNDF